MSQQKAKAHYTGMDGHQKMNCAQAVGHAFHDKFALSQEELADLALCGGGRAPGGLCGSLYAAKTILEKQGPHKVALFEDEFRGHAGSLTCWEIRSAKKLSCVGCVQKAAEYLERS